MGAAKYNILIIRGIAFQSLPAGKYHREFLGTTSNSLKINLLHSLEGCKVKSTPGEHGTTMDCLNEL